LFAARGRLSAGVEGGAEPGERGNSRVVRGYQVATACNRSTPWVWLAGALRPAKRALSTGPVPLGPSDRLGLLL
jgi:hypothetical protein